MSTAPVNILWKGTTDITDIVDWNTFDCVSVLTKERGTLQFAIILTSARSTSIPALGDDILLSDPSGAIFGGTVTEVETTVRKQQGGILLQAQITVTDYGYALDSKIVKTSYANQDPADILADLVTRFGPGGFDVSTYVQRGGFNVSTITFNYEQLTKCIQALANQIGWDWYVDPAKNVHFFFATTQIGSSEYDPAPITIDDNGGGLEWSSIDIDKNITNLKNSVYVIGGTYAKQFVDGPVAGANPPEYSPVDVYQTDGVKYVYPLAYKYSTSTISVLLNDVGQTVGVNQQQNPDDYDVMYDTSGFLLFPTPPSAMQTLKVEGVAQVPIVAHVQNSASIAEFGEYQDAINDSQITSVQEAQERGIADLTMFGHAVYDVKFNTISTGLRVGQIIFLNSLQFGVVGYPLIVKRIEATPFTPTKLRYQVEAIGSDTVTFNDMMLTLLQQQSAQTNVDPSTVLQVLIDIEDDVLVDDNVTITGTSAPYAYGTARAGFSVAS